MCRLMAYNVVLENYTRDISLNCIARVISVWCVAESNSGFLFEKLRDFCAYFPARSC